MNLKDYTYDEENEIYTCKYISNEFLSETNDLSTMHIKVNLTQPTEYIKEYYHDYKYYGIFFKFDPSEIDEIECRGDKCRRNISLIDNKIWCRSCHGELETDYIMDYLLKKVIIFEDIPKECIIKTIISKEEMDINIILKWVNNEKKTTNIINNKIDELQNQLNIKKEKIDIYNKIINTLQ